MKIIDQLHQIEALMEQIRPDYPELSARELKYKAAELLDAKSTASASQNWIDAAKANGTHLPIAQPDWIEGALESAEKAIGLCIRGEMPEAIKGWMLKTVCMRVLRSIYGSDLAVVNGLTADIQRKAEPETKQ